MFRWQFVLCGLILPLLFAALALSGCKKVDVDDSFEDNTSSGGKGAVVELKPIPMGDGVIKGRVYLKGSKPNLEQMTDALHKAMEKKDPDVCLAMNANAVEKSEQHYRIGANNGVGYVAVWLLPPDKKSYFAFDPMEDAKKVNLKPEQIEQPHCNFEPHVRVAFVSYPDPKNPRKMLPTGQLVNVINNATISHNTKWDGTSKIPSGNQLLPPGAPPLPLPLVPETVPLRIDCSIHPWMDAYIWALSHPYADVTKCDGKPALLKLDDDAYGTYEIRNVPTGVKLKIIAWHEEALFLTPDHKLSEAYDIELKPGETVTKDFEMEAK